jgi:outer membrane receptor protein involved in Fe transport
MIIRTNFFSFLMMSTALASGAMVTSAAAQEQPAAQQPAAQQPTTPPQERPQEVDVSGPGADDLGEIVVIGRNIPNVVRSTPEVVSVLTAEDIARTGDGDVAGALTRVTGLSVVGSGFVYVRGLGERYSLALLNGSPIPSPEPLRRSVPLDIFPTSLLSSSLVQKSYSVTYPGEFGGGAINLTTKAVPEEGFLTIGGGISGNSETTFELGYTYYGSNTDWLGFDSGNRSLPAPFEAALNSGNLIAIGRNFNLAQMKEITASLNNAETSLLQRNRNIPANFSADIEGGFAVDIGDNRLGVIASVGYANSWRTRGGLRQETNGLSVRPDGSNFLAAVSDFRFLETQNQVVVNGLLGVGYEFGDNQVRWTNLIIRDTVKEGRLSRGFDRSRVGDDELQRFGTSWFERQLLSTQLTGEFKPTDDLSVDVRANFARSTRDAPYERETSYRFEPRVRDFVNDLRSNGQTSRIAFSDLTDDVIGASLDVSYRLPTDFKFALSAGYTFFDNTRESVRRDFRFLPQSSLALEVAQQRIDFLLSDFNVNTYDILLTDTSGSAGAAAFEAGLRIHAGYLEAEAEPIDGLRITAGVRYESADQFVEPLDLFGTGGGSLFRTSLNNDYFLPALTVTWNFAEDMQLRLAGSRTLARPQFRELAPQQYRDLETGRTFFGNPFLRDSTLTNADLRYEWYPGRNDRFSVAGFFKRINRPIESVAFIVGETFLQTFANAPKADLYGVEVEAQKFFPLGEWLDGDFWGDRRLVAIVNYTFTQSELKVSAGDVTFPVSTNGTAVPATQLFSNGARLTGQSDHLLNFQIGIENEDRLSQATLLVNYSSKRASSRGPTGLPDLIERPGVRLDFVAREGFELFGYNLELKAEVRNILGEDYQETQSIPGSSIFNNNYEIGRSFSLSLDVKF